MSLLTSFTRPSAGGGQFDFVEAFDIVGAAAAASIVANQAYLHLFRVDRAVLVSKATYGVGTASGNVDLGIYTSADQATFTRVASTGSTAASGSSTFQTISLTAAYQLVPFTDYWAVFAADNATITANRTGAITGGTFRGRSVIKTTAWSSGLPTSITSVASGSAVWIAFHA